MNVVKELEAAGIVPVVRAPSAEMALDACRALVTGGIRVLEVTLTVPGAVDVIKKLRKELGARALVGAGTVLTEEAAQDCLSAGAQFVVTPGLNLKVIELCRKSGVSILPGALTPSEVITAWQAGADIVKIFPASALGGPKYLRALRGPLPDVKLMPTGGVNLGTADAYLAAGAVALGVGSELVDAISLRSGRYDVIEQRAREYVSAVQEARRVLGKNDAA